MAKVGVDVPQTDAKAPFPYRTLISAILLAGNILVAAIYFNVINPQIAPQLFEFAILFQAFQFSLRLNSIKEVIGIELLIALQKTNCMEYCSNPEYESIQVSKLLQLTPLFLTLNFY